eukprot:NODE_1544_length_585_cov_311.829004_g1531_i0.p1 GENE.NODE_1544_length_585_cov_311.829004_g1531_i0~~NODE_1544_length_585_cov_311.829004_g1531_i0.p1  ORF type:complete len:194 (-),score=37.75 NODE_1544_length_585_cov_311.829004_g1531_i0:3-521(-)
MKELGDASPQAAPKPRRPSSTYVPGEEGDAIPATELIVRPEQRTQATQTVRDAVSENMMAVRTCRSALPEILDDEEYEFQAVHPDGVCYRRTMEMSSRIEHLRGPCYGARFAAIAVNEYWVRHSANNFYLPRFNKNGNILVLRVMDIPQFQGRLRAQIEEKKKKKKKKSTLR